MLEETASVVSVDGDTAQVTLTRSEACGSCSAKSMCHPAGEKKMVMEVLNPAGAQPGDRVIISLPPAELLKASATAYMMPAVAAVGGGAIGWKWTGADLGAIIGCLAGLILATVWLLIQSKRKSGPVPFISRVLKDGRTTG
jgi:sigma-E factor negative regulatory protein RseC